MLMGKPPRGTGTARSVARQAWGCRDGVQATRHTGSPAGLSYGADKRHDTPYRVHFEHDHLVVHHQLMQHVQRNHRQLVACRQARKWWRAERVGGSQRAVAPGEGSAGRGQRRQRGACTHAGASDGVRLPARRLPRAHLRPAPGPRPSGAPTRRRSPPPPSACRERPGRGGGKARRRLKPCEDMQSCSRLAAACVSRCCPQPPPTCLRMACRPSQPWPTEPTRLPAHRPGWPPARVESTPPL